MNAADGTAPLEKWQDAMDFHFPGFLQDLAEGHATLWPSLRIPGRSFGPWLEAAVCFVRALGFLGVIGGDSFLLSNTVPVCVFLVLAPGCPLRKPQLAEIQQRRRDVFEDQLRCFRVPSRQRLAE